MTRHKKPSFTFETKLWQEGYIVIGIDEVGRGPLAGPVTVGAVCFGNPAVDFTPGLIENTDINDSKILSLAKRNKSASFIKENAYRHITLSGSVEDINQQGIAKVIQKLMSEAAEKIISLIPAGQKCAVVADGIYKPSLAAKNSVSLSLIDGDALSYTIAAASIIAKVERDDHMRQLSNDFPQYDWEKNKGYGTRKHIEAIKSFGATPHHRTLFIRSIT